MFNKDIKILVVDDMMTMRKLVRKQLADLGFRDVLEAGDGKAAWLEIEKARLAKTPFALIISDWNMPEMKGIELLKKVRSTAGHEDTPFIMLTAESEASQLAEAEQLKVTGYLPKPFKAEDLEAKLKAASQVRSVKKAA